MAILLNGNLTVCGGVSSVAFYRLAAILTGCVGHRDGPTIDGDELVLSFGERVETTIQASAIGGFSFHPTPEGVSIEVSLGDRCDTTPGFWGWLTTAAVVLVVTH